MDLQAEAAIRKAMKDLIEEKKPLNAHTVPDRAAGELAASAGIPVGDAWPRVTASVEAMRAAGSLTASAEPWVDWKIT